jgi:hypothetical protein
LIIAVHVNVLRSLDDCTRVGEGWPGQEEIDTDGGCGEAELKRGEGVKVGDLEGDIEGFGRISTRGNFIWVENDGWLGESTGQEDG